MGIGMALFEHTNYDPQNGAPINSNLADYVMSVNADVPAIDVHFIELPFESDDRFEVLPWTADWAYLRLRKVSYGDSDLTTWLERLRAAGVAEAQVFFKHEDAATGPKLAERLLVLAGQVGFAQPLEGATSRKIPPP